MFSRFFSPATLGLAFAGSDDRSMVRSTSTLFRTQASRLFANDSTVSRKEMIARYEKALSLPTDLKRRKLVFQKHNASCHRLGGGGGIMEDSPCRERLCCYRCSIQDRCKNASATAGWAATKVIGRPPFMRWRLAVRLKFFRSDLPGKRSELYHYPCVSWRVQFTLPG